MSTNSRSGYTDSTFIPDQREIICKKIFDRYKGYQTVSLIDDFGLLVYPETNYIDYQVIRERFADIYP